MNHSDRPKRPLGLGGYVASLGATVVVAVLAGVGTGVLRLLPGPLGVTLTVAALSVAMAAGLAACLWWWRGIDEAAREAHKWAWWWGGSGGLAVGGVVLLTLMARDEARLLPSGVGSDSTDIFVSGMMAVALFQLAGYALAWAGWWLKHR